MIAEEITDAGGTAAIWLARPDTTATERDLATSMAAARATEYAKIITETGAAAHLDATARQALGRRLRTELRQIQRRDYFPPAERDHAVSAVETLINTAAPRQRQP
ncbi:MAG: hypothetical protein ACJ72N_04785 [Labedaea sp.]